jgi:hypothetical protein
MGEQALIFVSIFLNDHASSPSPSIQIEPRFFDLTNNIVRQEQARHL